MARRQQLTISSIIATGGSTSVDWQGGNGSLIVDGTFGGTSAKLQLQGPNQSWYDVTTTPITAGTPAGMLGFIAPAGPLRIFLTGGAGITLTAWIVGIPTNNGG